MSFFYGKFKAVIFDLDGVIIDSEPIHMHVMNTITSQWGKSQNWEEYVRNIGKSDEHIWTDLKNRLQLDMDVDQLIELYCVKLTEYFLQSENIPIVEGIPELLDVLHKEDIACAVGSASSHTNIGLTLKHIKNKQYFKAISSGDDVKKSKPAPDIFLHAAELLQIQPEDCAVIEDASHGVQAAKTAQMYCVGYINHTSGKQDLSNADKIIYNIRELL
jgi:HAD superfamily hydrolase (TIGR01549 family)